MGGGNVGGLDVGNRFGLDVASQGCFDDVSQGTPLMTGEPPQFLLNLIAYNLIRLMMAQAATLAACLPRELSFKHTLQVWIAWDHHPGTDREGMLYGLFVLISEQRVGNRPGRIEPRAVKRRPKPFALLTKPRALAREEIRKHGHPGKVK